MSVIRRRILYTILLVAVSSNCTKHKVSTLREILQKSILAPSWQFQSIDHKWKWHQQYNDKGLQALSIFVKEFEASYKAAKRELVLMFGEESLIESRLRPMESISQELDDDGNTTVKDLYDLVDAKFRFINSTRFGVAIVKCFGVCPRAGRYSATGYRGITLIAEIDGKPLEVQLMTPYMVMWADWAYGVLLDKSLGSEKDVQKYSRQLSKYYYELDSLRDKRPACPKTLRKTNMKSLMKEAKIFDALGGPLSACQFWNDLTVNKNLNTGARREVIGQVIEQKSKGHGNEPSVIDIDKILKPGDLEEGKGKGNGKESKGSKRSSEWPVYYYY
ncbi:Hypothetical predicted protein [Paramuricea clavata]|uniref:Uncharacterized protein n=1 Tax=Paramuricea clavata TaxID=317549 RepID=A0A6S7GI06_PARCT|nr:Hypothetical predicted protein [Paramuricea clavata]